MERDLRVETLDLADGATIGVQVLDLDGGGSPKALDAAADVLSVDPVAAAGLLADGAHRKVVRHRAR